MMGGIKKCTASLITIICLQFIVLFYKQFVVLALPLPPRKT